jgi:hypothetical protein
VALDWGRARAALRVLRPGWQRASRRELRRPVRTLRAVRERWLGAVRAAPLAAVEAALLAARQVGAAAEPEPVSDQGVRVEARNLDALELASIGEWRDVLACPLCASWLRGTWSAPACRG